MQRAQHCTGLSWQNGHVSCTRGRFSEPSSWKTREACIFQWTYFRKLTRSKTPCRWRRETELSTETILQVLPWSVHPQKINERRMQTYSWLIQASSSTSSIKLESGAGMAVIPHFKVRIVWSLWSSWVMTYKFGIALKPFDLLKKDSPEFSFS